MSSVKKTFDDINQLDCFGYLPTSSSIKPAHIANGWFRRLLGKYYDPVLLNQTVIHWTQNGEINPSDRLLADNPSVFEPFRPVAKRSEFEDLRSDLKLLVSPSGGAVNKGNRLSSYNITCERHVTEDYNDRHVGAFLHQLVSADFGSGPSPVVGLILQILLNPRDEISSVTAPLVFSAKATDVSIGTYKAESVFKKKGKSFASPTLKNLRAGFDNLAAFETSYGGGLDALRRSVAFGVFALLLHMTNRESETAGIAGPAPLLLYFADRQRTTAYQASHATYNRARRSIALLDKVGLGSDAFGKYPHEFSGGQRQRIAIARCLTMRPEIIVCDESVSALDVSVQATVLNLLLDLQEEFGLSYLFISHDLAVVKYMADEILVMHQGEVVERGNPGAIYANPQHAYTRQLLDAIPRGLSASA